MDQLQEVANANITESYKDFVGLWETVIDIERAFPDKELTDDEVRDFSLQVVQLMLADQNVRAGEYTKVGFAVWDSPQEAIIDRITSEWTQLGARSPDPFGIVSFGALPLIKSVNEAAAHPPARVEQRQPAQKQSGQKPNSSQRRGHRRSR